MNKPNSAVNANLVDLSIPPAGIKPLLVIFKLHGPDLSHSKLDEYGISLARLG